MTQQPSADRLNTTLLTMDVVDQIRHRDSELAALAGSGDDDAALTRRLRQIYQSQGIEVDDDVLSQGIAAHRDRRFVYVAPSGAKALLARAWINRRMILAGIALVIIGQTAAFAFHHYLVFVPAERRLNAAVQQHNDRIAVMPVLTSVALAQLDAAIARFERTFKQSVQVPNADRLLPLRASTAAKARTGAGLPPAPVRKKDITLVRAGEEVRVVGADGQDSKLIDARAFEAAKRHLDDREAALRDIEAATKLVTAAADQLQLGMDVSSMLDVANAAAVAASLPDTADVARRREFAAGVSALRGGDIPAARAAVARLDRLVADVAALASIGLRAGELLSQGLATGVAGEDRQTFEAAHREVLSLANTDSVEPARAALAELESMVSLLSVDYALRIVSKPGAKSGVWRRNSAAPDSRNHYLIVEAIPVDGGNPLRLSILNEENSITALVDTFAVRVPESEFDRVRSDKQDNGIVDSPVIGRKPRGALKPRFDIPTAGGFITAW